ncbi:acyl-homoserine-lactone synthase [Nguyenibacter vanlangensis]|nr:acyl-homoserine-lactone synthase [Nguyenibacter vanlangensis]
MIKVVNAKNINPNVHYIASFARLRHRVFIEKLRWNLPLHDDASGHEYDSYDTEDATYILVCNGVEVVAGVRLIKTTQRFLLGELFPHLERTVVPTGKDVLEVTRFVVEPERERLGSVTDPVGELVVALLEYGVANRLRNFISVSYAGMERLLARTGCQIGRLGSPLRFDGRMTVPLKFDISREILTAAKARLSGLAVVAAPTERAAPVPADLPMASRTTSHAGRYPARVALAA